MCFYPEMPGVDVGTEGSPQLLKAPGTQHTHFTGGIVPFRATEKIPEE